MAVPYIFASTLGGSNIPLQWLDDDFAYLTSSPSFSGNVAITGTLGVGGAVTFSSTLNVAGITTLSNDLSVAGSSSFTGGATFSNSITFDSKTITGTTGTGNFVLSVSPTVTRATLVAPALGTPTSGNLANCTNLPVSGIDGLGTGVANFLSVPSSANLAAAVTGETGTGALVFGTNPTITNPTLTTPALGTPQSGVLTNCTGLPVTSGISGFGTNVATFLATPSSANLRSALTDETGTGSAVFANTPTLVSPVLGTPTSGTLTNCTGLPLTTGITGVLPVANGGTGISSLTTGYIPFGGATTFSSDSNLFWDNIGKRLGVGTSTPVYKLDVAGSARISDLASIAGPLFVGPQDTSTVFQGMRLTNGADSSASQTVSYIDTTNDLGIPDSNIFFTHETDGSSFITFATTPAGARNADRRVQRFLIGPNGQAQVERTAALAGWGVSAKSFGVSNESGVYFDASNNAQIEAKNGSGATQVRWQTASPSANLVDGLPAYVCRAWVNFNGTGTVAIQASGNISSITDNGVGDYTINFTTSLTDANYAVSGGGKLDSTNVDVNVPVIGIRRSSTNPTASSVRIVTNVPGTGAFDCEVVTVAIFR